MKERNPELHRKRVSESLTGLIGENRTIKFRAWDGERMIYDVQNIYDTIVRLKTSDGEDVNQFDTKLPCVSDFGELLRCENVPIMQFTGLLDKNGKEIYEGDIVKGMSPGTIGKVKYGGMCFGFIGKKADGSQWYDTWDNSEFYGFPHIKEVEVVGNIHENGDLLCQK